MQPIHSFQDCRRAWPAHENDFSHDEIKVLQEDLLTNHPKLQPNTFRKTPKDKAKPQRALVYGRAVGGTSNHFTANFWRFHEIDFIERSKIGPIAGSTFSDWPVKYADLEPYYTKVEWEVGVSGLAGASPFDPPRSKPYPMMNAQESFGAKMDADLLFAVNVKGLYPKWETKPGEKIDGQDTWLVIGEKEGAPPLRLYFDQKSGLLVRLVRYVDSPLGYNPTQIDYADYRAAEGVKVAYRWTVARPGNHFTVQVEQLQQNVPVDDARFVPPPPPPPLPPGSPAAH